MDDGDVRPFMVVAVDDSPDSRLFVELSSYAADLTEARVALDLAIESQKEGSALGDATPFLVASGVVAYCRTILHSNVRRRLTEHLAIPGEFVAVHEQVKSYRNATLAHSQSELAVTYAVGIVESETLRIRDVQALTMLVPLPRSVVTELRSLIFALEDRLDEVIRPVRDRLIDKMAEMDRAQMRAAAGPVVRELTAREFNPRTRRAAYPAGHTVYWESAPDEGLPT